MKAQFFDWINKFLWFKPIVKDEPPLIVIPHETMLWDKYRTLLETNNLNTVLRKAHFFGQIKQESNFIPQRESLNYRTDVLINHFGRHRISIQQANEFGRNSAHPANQEVLANILYGGEWGRINLGNTKPGDGWFFRGAGLKQITGRDNFQRLSDHTGVDYVNHPEWLLREADSMIAAVWFWNNKRINRYADENDYVNVTRSVNGGLTDLNKRMVYTDQFKEIIT